MILMAELYFSFQIRNRTNAPLNCMADSMGSGKILKVLWPPIGKARVGSGVESSVHSVVQE